MTDRDIRVKLRNVKERLTEYYKKSHERREEFNEELAKSRMEEGDEEVAKSICEIKKEEARRREFLKIRAATKKERGATLPVVQVPWEAEGVDGMWEMLKVKRQEPEG